MEFRDALRVVDAFAALAGVIQNREVLQTLVAARDEAVAQQKTLGDAHAAARAVDQDRKQLAAEREAHRRQVDIDKQALDTQRAALERDKRIHNEAARVLADERKAFDALHQEFLKFRKAVA